jgi:hypothetical protein
MQGALIAPAYRIYVNTITLHTIPEAQPFQLNCATAHISGKLDSPAAKIYVQEKLTILVHRQRTTASLL